MPTSRELVRSVLHGQPIGRPVTGPLAVHFCAALVGATLQQYTTQCTTLVESILRYRDAFRPDAIWLSADTWVSAQAMGAQVGFTDASQPLGGRGEPLVQTAADIDAIVPPDPGSQGRWPMMVTAMQRLVQECGNDVFIVACFDQYPFSLACALMGIDQLMLKLVDDPALVNALMAKCEQSTVAYALALAAAGADMLSGGDSPAGLVGPAMYHDVVLPAEQRVIRQIHAACDTPVSLHICGGATPLLSGMARSGADVLEIDHQVDLAAAARTVGPQTGLWGNLDPVGVLALGTTDYVRRETARVLATMDQVKHARFVLSSGCTLAVGTPAENLHAMLETARQWPEQ